MEELVKKQDLTITNATIANNPQTPKFYKSVTRQKFHNFLIAISTVVKQNLSYITNTDNFINKVQFTLDNSNTRKLELHTKACSDIR